MPHAQDLVLERPPRWIGGLAVVLVHVLLLMWLGSSVRRSLPTPPADRSQTLVTLRLQPLSRLDLLPGAAPSRRGPASPTAQVSASSLRRPASSDRASPPQVPRNRAQRAVATDTAPAATVMDAVPLGPQVPALAASSARPPMAAASESPIASRPPASGPSGRDLMQGEATRLAIRQATRGAPLLSERADQASQAPARLDATARLGRDIKDAGAGDCLKGEYAGGGMGLLSAPFLLLAEARGKCAK